jgi:hypothetical protein
MLRFSVRCWLPVALLTLTCWTVAGVPAVVASPPSAPVQAGNSVANTTWSGSEDLAGFGKLTFQFKGNGAVTMTDAKSSVPGTWTQNGSKVEIRFSNCVYIGYIDNNGVLSGTAAYTTGPNNGLSWSFCVQK